jgi:putative ABC transport system substrate-binding protein
MFLGATLALAALRREAAAQNTAKVARIGWITAQQASSLTPYIAALRKGLGELGYAEGDNLVLVFRFGDDAIERVPEMAAELERIPVDLIIAQGAAVPDIAKLRLKVPVVFVYSGDPVSAGLADSLARPRDNMTGLTFMAAELNGKRLDLLREIMPQIKKVAIVANPEHPGAEFERTYSEKSALRLGLAIDYYPTRSTSELTQAFAAMAANPPQAISLFADGFAIQNRDRIMDFAMNQHAPVVSGWPIFARSGALCTYGPRLTESYRRLAYYVDRVLKGAKPADLPIEQPTQFEFVVNLRTAKKLGLSIPQSMLVRADEIIQ